MAINEIVKVIMSVNDIALVCHINPDGDTICSALALKRLLDKIGKNNVVLCDGEVTGNLASVPYAATINCIQPKDKYQLTIAVDCGDLGRMGKYAGLIAKSENSICIDHHISTGSYAKYSLVDSKAAATAELIYSIISKIGIEYMDEEIAELLYIALITDTGNFSYSNTTRNTMTIAGKLLSYNIDNASLSYKFYKETSIEVFNLKNRVLSKAMFFENHRIGIIHFSQEDLAATGTTTSHTSNIANELINIKTVDIAISITDVKTRSYKVSVRTSDNIDANRIAMTFGGGGHKNASGFVLNGYFENVLDDILKACTDNL